jgi:glycosyltransferase involved in cell wall biosynthesis
LGAQKQEDVRKRLYEAGVFALPSVVTARGDRDGIPVALMEAMACGIPVVSTRVSGIPELVEDGVSGLVALPGSADDLARCLALLLNDIELGGRLAIKAREQVEREFDIQKEVRKLHDAIASN